MKKVDQIALLLLMFAGFIWGLWGLFQWNLVWYVFGEDWIDRVIYVILGIASIYVGFVWKDFGIRWSSRNKKR